jgi:hypothetical protein
VRWRTSCAVMKTGFCGFCELEKQVTAQSADRCDVPQSWTWSPAAAAGHASPTMSSSTAGTSGRTSASWASPRRSPTASAYVDVVIQSSLHSRSYRVRVTLRQGYSTSLTSGPKRKTAGGSWATHTKLMSINRYK